MTVEAVWQGGKASPSVLVLGEGSRHKSLLFSGHRWPAAHPVAWRRNQRYPKSPQVPCGVPVKASLRKKKLGDSSWEPALSGQPQGRLAPRVWSGGTPCRGPSSWAPVKRENNFSHTSSLCPFVAQLHSNILTQTKLLNRNRKQKYHRNPTNRIPFWGADGAARTRGSCWAEVCGEWCWPGPARTPRRAQPEGHPVRCPYHWRSWNMQKFPEWIVTTGNHCCLELESFDLEENKPELRIT